jgi:hypothetical protein
VAALVDPVLTQKQENKQESKIKILYFLFEGKPIQDDELLGALGKKGGGLFLM